MNSEEKNDRLVDTLLWELVGRETPPDVRQQVLARVDELPVIAVIPPSPRAFPVPLRSARPSKVPALAMAALLTLLGVAGMLLRLGEVAGEVSPRLTVLGGEVSCPSGAVPRGAEIEVGADSHALLTYEDGTTVELAPETTVVVGVHSRWERAKQLKLLSGKVEAEVARQKLGREMLFISKDARARVLGTSLSFECLAGRARLEVTEGVVNFEPQQSISTVRVEAGYFAETGAAGLCSGALLTPPREGIVSFTLMNAKTNQPLREEPLAAGEVIALSALPTREINLRANYEGEPPTVVRLAVTREDGQATGLAAHLSSEHRQPPFFVAGDHWGKGRPDDCRAWTPRPGVHLISASVVEAADGKLGEPLNLTVTFKE